MAVLRHIKLVLFLGFFVALLAITGSAQKDILEQNDPTVLNFLAVTYCPGIVRPDGSPPLTILDTIIKGEGLDGQGGWEQLAARRHRRSQPGYQQPWQVRFVKLPSLGAAQNSWTITRLMSGMAPEIMHAQSTPDYWDKCHLWYEDLTEFLKQPNPYIPGNKRWGEIFNKGVLAFWASSATGGFYCVPINQVEVGIFYNKTIMAECGIGLDELPPRDWAHFIDIQDRIKKAGHVPFFLIASGMARMTWVYYILNDMLYAEIYDQLNAVDNPNNSRTWGISVQEKVRGHKLGIVSVEDDRYWETWRIIKHWSQYWQDGALGTVDQTGFQRGRAAMTLDSSGFIRKLVNDEKLDFEWGVFFFPKLTKATSRFAVGALPRGVGGPANVQYTISRASARRKGSVQACVDLLRWITAPQNLGPMVSEEHCFLPAVRVPEKYIGEHLRYLMPVLERGHTRCYKIAMLGVRGQAQWWATMQYFIEGTYDRQDVIREMKATAEEGIEELLEKFKDKWQWEYDDQGNCTWQMPSNTAE